MPRGVYKRKDEQEEIKAISVIPSTAFTQQTWWDKLNEDEQKTVLNESQQLAGAMLVYGNSRLSIGEHLTKLQAVLEPHNLFTRYLKTFHFSKKTAYRYIAGFKNARTALPEPILREAMKRGISIVGESEMKPLGIYTDAVAALPPPKEIVNEVQAVTYLNQLEDVRKQVKSQEGKDAQTFGVPNVADPQATLRECYKFTSLRIRKLPANSKVRVAFIQKLFGMLLRDLGVSGPQTFTPQAVPEEFQTHRGRPAVGPTMVA